MQVKITKLITGNQKDKHEMSNIKKQKLLSESLQAMGVSDVVREDLEKYTLIQS